MDVVGPNNPITGIKKNTGFGGPHFPSPSDPSPVEKVSRAPFQKIVDWHGLWWRSENAAVPLVEDYAVRLLAFGYR